MFRRDFLKKLLSTTLAAIFSDVSVAFGQVISDKKWYPAQEELDALKVGEISVYSNRKRVYPNEAGVYPLFSKEKIALFCKVELNAPSSSAALVFHSVRVNVNSNGDSADKIFVNKLKRPDEEGPTVVLPFSDFLLFHQSKTGFSEESSASNLLGLYHANIQSSGGTANTVDYAPSFLVFPDLTEEAIPANRISRASTLIRFPTNHQIVRFRSGPFTENRVKKLVLRIFPVGFDFEEQLLEFEA